MSNLYYKIYRIVRYSTGSVQSESVLLGYTMEPLVDGESDETSKMQYASKPIWRYEDGMSGTPFFFETKEEIESFLQDVILPADRILLSDTKTVSIHYEIRTVMLK